MRMPDFVLFISGCCLFVSGVAYWEPRLTMAAIGFSMMAIGVAR
jgi:hypothetical protein